jgi:hypothetical protein
MVRNQNIVQSIARIRKNQPHRQADPISISSLNLPEELKVTFSGMQFFYDTDGELNSDEILMFTTVKNLKWMIKYPTWYGDGTFDVAPSLCKQLYTIHVIIESNSNMINKFT